MNGRPRESGPLAWLVTFVTVAVVTGIALFVLDLILDAISKGPKLP